MLKAGPTWCTTGKAFDHLGKSEIAQIFIFRGDDSIFYIQILYAEDGGNKLVLSEKIGSSSAIGSNSLNTVTLDYPSEFITGVSGKYRQFVILPGPPKLRSITFHTNKRKYGPFEASPIRTVRFRETETEFSYDVGSSKFCGIFGTYLSDGIESIGIYVKPIEKLPNNPIKKEAI
ncbi:inactive protein RESTRICTED TEV MOVEMENT 1-like [Heracleum sosnowskyi]|uniref:Inactive protein RESTRICTED TEV MOVEMENT 1-like n=1 Tax=Heracleum sosnowskyi TaxID=360622 RepID=A0AAD8GM34_9APIA|nr:inactive protein RESTRICTED TEV MOVEMENT 1-like [Heracleum sosnowskyi]